MALKDAPDSDAGVSPSRQVLPDLAETNFGALCNCRDVFYADGSASLGFEDGLFDVVDVGEEADLADVDLLLAPAR